MSAPPISERHLPHFHRRSPILEAVRVATTGNLSISTGLNAGDAVDGVTLAAGDRVLARAQSAGAENGIYVAGATPARAYDLSTDDPSFGFLVYVREGTTLGGKTYRSTNTSTPTIGSTSLTFAELSAAGVAALDDLSDVAITTPSAGQRLRYDGSGWVNTSLHHQVLFDGTGSAILNGLGDPIETEVI